MLKVKFRELVSWPGVATKYHMRRRSPFSAPYGETLELLDRELEHLKAKDVVIEADCDASQIRLDGYLRSSAKLRGPGIVVSFDSPMGPMRFPCDAFTHWEANLRGIALTMERLRSVDRYGVTKHSEQYKGWNALEDKRSTGEYTREYAIRWIAAKGRDVVGLHLVDKDVADSREVRDSVIKALKSALHPDRRGSDVEFKELMLAIAAFEEG